jgi:hypothetical protein
MFPSVVPLPPGLCLVYCVQHRRLPPNSSNLTPGRRSCLTRRVRMISRRRRRTCLCCNANTGSRLRCSMPCCVVRLRPTASLATATLHLRHRYPPASICCGLWVVCRMASPTWHFRSNPRVPVLGQTSSRHSIPSCRDRTRTISCAWRSGGTSAFTIFARCV